MEERAKILEVEVSIVFAIRDSLDSIVKMTRIRVHLHRVCK